MTNEEKELLLKDLCARLPYHTQCYCKWLEKAPNGTSGCVQELSTFVIDEIEIMDDPQFKYQICDVKPYLRPMSSMSAEENIEYQKRINVIQDIDRTLYWFDTVDSIDWLNANHFDYRGLIEKGLALEAPEGMYK